MVEEIGAIFCFRTMREHLTFLNIFVFYPGLIRLPKIPISEASLLYFGSPDDKLFSGLLHFLTKFLKIYPKMAKRPKNEICIRKTNEY